MIRLNSPSPRQTPNITKGSVFKVHFIEDFYSWFILARAELAGLAPTISPAFLHTDAGIRRSCILCFKVFLRIVQIAAVGLFLLFIVSPSKRAVPCLFQGTVSH